MSYYFHGIDHVQLAAPEGCELKARHFFKEMLGWEELPKPIALQNRGGVWFQCGKHQVHIGVQSNFTAATKAHPAFHVHNLDALITHLSNYQVEIIHDEARAEENIKRCYIHDPFGNRLEFLEWL